MNSENYKKTKKTGRSSNFELLRICCILWIISDHVFQGNPIVVNDTASLLAIWTLPSLSRVSCTIFVLIGAYFLVDSDFKFRRVFHIWWTTLFYCVLIGLALFSLGLTSWDLVKFSLFPISNQPLWFCSTYILILIASPMFNMLINNLDQRSHFWLLVFWAIPILIIPTIRAECAFFRPEIWPCIYAYFFAGYIKKYQPVTLQGNYVIILLCSIPIFRILLLYMFKDSQFFGIVSHYCEFWRSMLNAVPNFATAVGIFCLFKKMTFQSAKINLLAKSVLGVYVIHQVPCFYPYLWNGIFHAQSMSGTENQIQYTFFMIICVFCVATVVDSIKQQTLGKIVEKNSYVLKLCDFIDGIMNSRKIKCKGMRTDI